MGKRSSFERREADFYPTPRSAALPLIPFLRGVRTFAEPCAGDGNLVRHLEGLGLRCVYAGDISTGQDALAIDSYGACDAIITNPPYTRDLMHRLIEHLQRIAPTWLLMETDWVSTLQAVPYLVHCSDIVTIGRLKWLAESKHTGKDNYGWFRFDARYNGVTAIHRRNQAEVISPRTRVCEQCGKRYEQWLRSSSRFCSAACKQLAYRKRLSVTPSVTSAPSGDEEFRYVAHADVPRFEAEGWEAMAHLSETFRHAVDQRPDLMEPYLTRLEGANEVERKAIMREGLRETFTRRHPSRFQSARSR
jgi:hypothetical protein